MQGGEGAQGEVPRHGLPLSGGCPWPWGTTRGLRSLRDPAQRYVTSKRVLEQCRQGVLRPQGHSSSPPPSMPGSTMSAAADAAPLRISSGISSGSGITSRPHGAAS